MQPSLFAKAFRPLRILCGHEASGALRSRFRAAGHEAYSCDLRASYDNSPYHIQGDIFDVIGQPWDLAFFQPECTMWTVSGAWAFNDPDFDRYPGVGYHQKVKPGTPVGAVRRAQREIDLAHWWRLDKESQHIRAKVYENPVGTIWGRFKPYTQTIQPYELGDDASKRTCFRIEGVAPVVIDPAKRVPGRWVEWPKGSGRMVERWSNQTDSGQNKLTPGADRWAKRSDNWPGFCDAFVEQFPPQLY